VGTRIRINATTAAYAESRGLDAVRISRGLYQGHAPPPGRHVADAGFDMLVLCAKNFQPYAVDYPGVRVLRCPLVDEPLTARAWEASTRAADEVVDALRRGERVLVTCERGKNRSSLVTAEVLCRTRGIRAEDAIRTIRSARPGALDNESYAEGLRSAWP